MSRKTAGIIAIIAAAGLAVYMLSQGAGPSVPVDEGAPAAASKPAVPVVDEQALALEEMRREAGKSGLSRLYIVKCSSCHGRDGKGPVGPSITGKGREYNMEALIKYKNGQVPNTLMKGLLDKTSVEELNMLADEISAFK